MFETPRIVPHEVVHDDGQASGETREVDINKYGDCYDPKSFQRTKDVPGFDADKDYDSDAY